MPSLAISGLLGLAVPVDTVLAGESASGALALLTGLPWPQRPHFMTAEMKLATRLSGVPQLFIQDSAVRPRSRR